MDASIAPLNPPMTDQLTNTCTGNPTGRIIISLEVPFVREIDLIGEIDLLKL